MIASHRFNNQWSANLSLNYTHGRGYFEEYVDEWNSNNILFSNDALLSFYGIDPVTIGGETIETSDLIRRRWLNNNFYAANGNVNYKKDRWDVSSGIFYSYYGGDHFGEVIWARFAGDSESGDRYYSGNGDKNEATLFTKASYQLNPKWGFFADLQGRFVNYRTSGLTSDVVPLEERRTYEFFNPKAGISYQLNALHNFYLSYGMAHREPRRSDFEQGVFTPERLTDYELGWRYSSGRVQLNSNLYFMDYRDQLVLTGALDNVGAPIRATSGKSYRLGLELDATIVVSEKWSVRPNVALSENKNVDFITSIDGALVNLGKTNISFSPNVVAGNLLQFEPTQKVQLALLSKYVGAQYMGNIDSETSKLEGYFVNDLNVNYTIDNLPFGSTLVLSALLNNIFDVEYVSNGYFFTYDDDFSNPGTVTTIEGAGYYPQAKFNFLVGASLRF